MSKKVKKVYVIDDCIACGSCFSSYPELFKSNENNQSVAVEQDWSGKEADIDAAIVGCPVQAIKKEEEAEVTESTSVKKVYVNGDDCIRCGLCYREHPDLFKEGDTGESVVIEQDWSGKAEGVNDAIDRCPVNAIKKD